MGLFSQRREVRRHEPGPNPAPGFPVVDIRADQVDPYMVLVAVGGYVIPPGRDGNWPVVGAVYDHDRDRPPTVTIWADSNPWECYADERVTVGWRYAACEGA